MRELDGPGSEPHPERQGVRHPAPIITRRCSSPRIPPDEGIRIEELENSLRGCPLQGTPIPMGHLQHDNSYHRRVPQDGPPPLPPLPASSYTFPQDRRPSITLVSVPLRRTTASPSMQSRSLPVPPSPSSTKPSVPPLPIMPSDSSLASPDARACLINTTSPTSASFMIIL